MGYTLVQAQLAASPTEEIKEEAKLIGTPEGAEGSKERISWFQKWVNNLPEEKDEGPGGMDMASLQNMMGGGGMGGGGMGGKGGGKGKEADGYPEKEPEEV